jgi:uncharacterized protein YaaQ
MKLVIAIVHDEDSHELMKNLSAEKFNITKLASTGGFLKTGNTTLLIGAKKEKIDDILKIIENTCKTRKEYTMTSSMIGETSSFIGQPIEVSVGGATVFILDIDQFAKF